MSDAILEEARRAEDRRVKWDDVMLSTAESMQERALYANRSRIDDELDVEVRRLKQAGMTTDVLLEIARRTDARLTEDVIKYQIRNA